MKKKTKKILAGLVIAGLALAIYVDNQCFVARENKVVIENKKITSPIKVTQISDFHSNAIKNLDEVLANIKNFDPDFIVLTGDIIDYATEAKIERSVYYLEKLGQLGIQTYYITGNHEEGSPGSEVFYREVERLGIKYLDNEGEFLEVGGQKIYIYGTSMFGYSLENYHPSPDSINLVLSHFSRKVRENYREDMDIIFSGHTHGGQVRLPIVGALLAPGEGYLPKYDKGVFSYKNSTIHIDSGLGNTFLPLRFMDQIQYSNIILAPVV